MNLSILIIFLSLFSTVCLLEQEIKDYECVHGAYPPSKRLKVPTYAVYLNLPPIQRWHDIGKHESQQIKALFNVFKDELLNISHYFQYIINFVDTYFPKLVDTLPYPFGEELKGLAIAVDMPLGEIVLYNIFYEIFTFCTSIIGYDKNGNMYHGRNLDFGIFMGWNETSKSWLIAEALKPSVINIEWHRGGKILFKSVNFAGYIGILTALKQNKFTLTMNERYSLEGGFLGILKWLLGERSGEWMSFLTRRTLENASNYDEAMMMLSNTKMLAPAYYILGGTKSDQAAIITRSWDKAVDVWMIGTRNSSWFLVQCNDDNWVKPRFWDDRRTPAKYCLNHLTQQNFGFDGLYNVLNMMPIRNKLTTYTNLMQVTTGQLETYIQYCPGDCPPW